jgi:hypothetical protein
MPKYQPYGLTEQDHEPPYSKIVPDRVKRLVELYHENHIEYPWTQEDDNEKIFEYRRTLKPESYRYTIEAIYRVRDAADKSKEYYFYQKKGKVLNDDDEPEYSNSLTYGFAVIPIHELRYNEKTKKKEPFKIREDPTYFFKWDKKEVAKLLEKSETPCNNLYIGIASGRTSGTLAPANDVMSVKHLGDFLNGDIDDLILLNKAGIMAVEYSTLGMIDKARARFEEEALKRIATVAGTSPSSLPQQQQPQPQ